MLNSNELLFTSESVTEGHPDKVCDQIADAVLDAIFKDDPYARVACECTTSTGMVFVMGEITTDCYVNITDIVRDVITDIGYTGDKVIGFDADSCAVITSLKEQSKDISGAVENAYEIRAGELSKEELDKEFNKIGAGDQGLMFGFACNETPELMPLPISLAHKLAKRLTYVRKQDILPYLRPDGKTQVTVKYKDGKPVDVETIVISTQHAAEINGETDNDKIQQIIRDDLIKHVIKPIVPDNLLKNTKYLINPSGRFVIGGPQADSGLTGRKIIVDTYGGYARHGGGSFSGKDPTKVDRSATYAARYVAKNIVKAGLADKCEVQIAYAIGVAHPVSIGVDTYCTNKVAEDKILKLIWEHFDLRPAAIIHNFNLRRPIYRQLSAYGHIGRDDLDLPWEKTDKAEILKQYV